MRVAFLCVHNRCRSQMAEGFARALGAGVLEAQSGGTMPGGEVHPLAVQVMRERGIDIAGQRSKLMDLEFARRADRVITMGCSAEEACPAYLLAKVDDWALDDPSSHGVEKFRDVRDDIERRVRALVEEPARGEQTVDATFVSCRLPSKMVPKSCEGPRPYRVFGRRYPLSLCRASSTGSGQASLLWLPPRLAGRGRARRRSARAQP